jgi:hypothetical protein
MVYIKNIKPSLKKSITIQRKYLMASGLYYVYAEMTTN